MHKLTEYPQQCDLLFSLVHRLMRRSSQLTLDDQSPASRVAVIVLLSARYIGSYMKKESTPFRQYRRQLGQAREVAHPLRGRFLVPRDTAPHQSSQGLRLEPFFLYVEGGSVHFLAQTKSEEFLSEREDQ